MLELDATPVPPGEQRRLTLCWHTWRDFQHYQKLFEGLAAVLLEESTGSPSVQPSGRSPSALR